jgi:hypothetical protein
MKYLVGVTFPEVWPYLGQNKNTVHAPSATRTLPPLGYCIMLVSIATRNVYGCRFVKAVKYKMYWYNVLQPPK